MTPYMAFELKQDEEVGHAIRRIVGERIEDALEVMRRQRRRPSDGLVHEVRRGVKKGRGGLRLGGDELGGRGGWGGEMGVLGGGGGRAGGGGAAGFGG